MRGRGEGDETNSSLRGGRLRGGGGVQLEKCQTRRRFPFSGNKNHGQFKPNLWNGKLDWIVMLRDYISKDIWTAIIVLEASLKKMIP